MVGYTWNKIKITESKENNSNAEYENKNEIIRFEEKLKEFKISFEKIALKNPKKFEEKRQALAISEVVSKNEEFLDYLYRHKKLPVKSLILLHGFDKKIIKRHEKYIISICIIAKENYTKIAEFIGLQKGIKR